MFERVLNNTNSYFDESYPSPLPPAPLNLQIWFKISAPLFNNTLPHPTIKLQRIKIFKTGFRKLLILSKLGTTLMTGGGSHLVCAIMTHGIRKSIYNSLLSCSPLRWFWSFNKTADNNF